MFIHSKSMNYRFLDHKSSKMVNNCLIIILNRMCRLKHRIKIFFGRSTKKFRNMFIIKNKLLLSDWRGKSIHYPESPKVSLHRPGVTFTISRPGCLDQQQLIFNLFFSHFVRFCTMEYVRTC